MSDSLSKGFYNGKPNPFEVRTVVLYRTCFSLLFFLFFTLFPALSRLVIQISFHLTAVPTYLVLPHLLLLSLLVFYSFLSLHSNISYHTHHIPPPFSSNSSSYSYLLHTLYHQLAPVRLVTSVRELERSYPGPKVVLATDSSLSCGLSKALLLRWGGDPRCRVVFIDTPEAKSLAAELRGKRLISDLFFFLSLTDLYSLSLSHLHSLFLILSRHL